MSLFDFLFGNKVASNSEILDDRIWISQNAKFKGLARELVERPNRDSVAILLVGHFADTLEKLTAVTGAYQGNFPVMATLANQMTVDIASKLSLGPADIIELIVAERHPLSSADDRLLQFAEELPCRCRVSHHLALDDPLLKQFVGEWLAGILESLGMTEDEAVESNMVSRRVKQAQQKIESSALGNRDADSAEEWFKENMPNG